MAEEEIGRTITEVVDNSTVESLEMPTVTHHESPARSRHHSPTHKFKKRGGPWQPPWSPHELHSIEVHARSKTPSPTCKKYERDAVYEEINEAVVRKREEESGRTLHEARARHKHEGIVMRRAREFERKSRLQCNRYSRQVREFENMMERTEITTKPPYKTRAQQERALGMSTGPSSRHGSGHSSRGSSPSKQI